MSLYYQRMRCEMIPSGLRCVRAILVPKKVLLPHSKYDPKLLESRSKMFEKGALTQCQRLKKYENWWKIEKITKNHSEYI